MRHIFLIAIGASTDKARACNLRLPSFEITGVPISPHQVAVLRAAHVEERSATPTLMLAGMPASPDHFAVLTPRKSVKVAEAGADLSSLGRRPSNLTRSTTGTVGPICVSD